MKKKQGPNKENEGPQNKKTVTKYVKKETGVDKMQD